MWGDSEEGTEGEVASRIEINIPWLNMNLHAVAVGQYTDQFSDEILTRLRWNQCDYQVVFSSGYSQDYQLDILAHDSYDTQL